MVLQVVLRLFAAAASGASALSLWLSLWLLFFLHLLSIFLCAVRTGRNTCSNAVVVRKLEMLRRIPVLCVNIANALIQTWWEL